MKQAILLMDIGGTHTRARLVMAGIDLFNRPEFIAEETSAISDKPAFVDFVEKFLSQSNVNITLSVLSFAGIVKDKTVTMTNWQGQQDLSLDDLVTFGLPNETTIFINDMEAAANCLIAYKTDKIDLEISDLYTVADSSIKHYNNSILIIPGTGVGVAGIMMPGLSGLPEHPAHVSCELQHTTICELDAAYTELIDALKQRLNKTHLSWEDFVSGKGLENIYHCLHALNSGASHYSSHLNAAEIAKNAVGNTNNLCVDALDCYYHVAGALTQVVALAFQPFAGIYMGGGTTKNNISFIKRSAFVEKLQDNDIRKGLLQSFPVYLVPEYMNLDGAMYLASLKNKSLQ